MCRLVEQLPLRFWLPSKSEDSQCVARSGIGVVLYLSVVFATAFFRISEPGITGSILSEVYPDLA